jgi:DNA-binding CsgD family transcriptional regulator
LGLVSEMTERPDTKSEEPITVEAASSGVTVCLSVAAPVAEIVVGMRLTADGEHVLVSLSSRPARAGAAAGAGALTRREREVLGLLSKGRTNAEIARALSISRETARTHVKRVYLKLGVSSRGELLGVV